MITRQKEDFSLLCVRLSYPAAQSRLCIEPWQLDGSGLRAFTCIPALVTQSVEHCSP